VVAGHIVVVRMVGAVVHTAVRTVGVAAQGVAVHIAAARIVAAFGLGLHTW